jgi:hypothetical protein
MFPPPMNRLSPEGRWLRLGLALAMILVLAALAFLRSERRVTLPALPCAFHAISGLPCLFCGGTRAACAILDGNPAAALRLNALAFPALAMLVMAFAALLVEAASGYPLAPGEVFLRRLNRFAPALVVCGLAWWMFHICSALRTPKPELVDFRNPIAAAARMLVAPGKH